MPLIGTRAAAAARGFGYLKAPAQIVPADYLVVAGGGSGGSVNSPAVGAGGGGAGGAKSGTAALVRGIVYTITVGAGGAQQTISGGPAFPGGNSSISGVETVLGGGRGGGDSSAGNGGSGGGGSYSGTGGLGTAGQGSNGAPGDGSSGGSGGGAAITSSITGSAVTYATGGPGGQYGQLTPHTTRTGYGDGGGGGANGFLPQAGNQGVVIISVPLWVTAVAVTGSPEVTATATARIYKFTGNGSITF